jgi:RNA polymerase sigma-70 factor (ECF subfamily)
MGGTIAIGPDRFGRNPARGARSRLQRLTSAASNGTDARRAAEQAARASYGKLIAILAVQSRDIAAAEDALSEALVAALATWPDRGVPENPEAWLVTAARNRLRNVARARLVRDLAAPELALREETDPQDAAPQADALQDARLRLLFVCAHPAIDPAARAPLMLQTVLGLSAEQIGRAFLVAPATMSQRLVRAKTRIRDTGLRFDLPAPDDMPGRLSAVLDAIYAAFGQGWEGLEHPDAPDALTGEAIWLARLIVDALPAEPEPKGLLALMLYCTARTPARRDAAGRFVPLDAQDTRLWDRMMIIEAEGLLTAAARARQFGRYQCEAAIQSVHVGRAVTGSVDRNALLTLYDLLVTQTESVGARIARAVLLADAGDPQAGIAAIEALDPARIAGHQPYWVARSAILERLGRRHAAAAALAKAKTLTGDPAVRAHLEDRRKALDDGAR